jgi:Dyp-type peroxidase family
LAVSELTAFLSQVQTSVLRGVEAQGVVYLFFKIIDRQAFVDALPASGDSEPAGWGLRSTLFCSESERLSSADPQSDSPVRGHAHIAFTYAGLEALDVDGRTLASFPEAFRDGMAARAAMLGDEGDAAPEHWDGYLGSRDVHGVTWFNIDLAATREVQAIHRALDGLRSHMAEVVPAAWMPTVAPAPRDAGPGSSAAEPAFESGEIPGAAVLHVEFGMANYHEGANGERYRIEHFGFRDGVSQPYADIGMGPPAPGGGTARADDSWKPVALGELLLGAEDEDGLIQHLPANRCLRTNGTYMVLRKLEQDVVGFRQFLARNNRGTKDFLAAQMIGRWPDGTPLVRSPNGPQADLRYATDPTSAPSAPTINDFRYQRDDPFGRRCPIGAHIRRANPRDTNNRDEARRHRLFRRGISYGGPLLPPNSPGDGHPRGLLFVAMQARIDRQFEFVQASWLNRAELVGQAGARLDPLTGRHAGRASDTFQPAGQPAVVTHLPRFVTMRGGDYFFVPSFEALAQFKAHGHFEPDDPEASIPQDALGAILPAKSDNSKTLIAIGKKLLAPDQPVFETLPPLPVQPFPGGPASQLRTIVIGRHKYVEAVLGDNRNFSMALFDARTRRITGGQRLLIGLDQGDPERTKRLKFLHDALSLMKPPPVAAIAARLTKAALDRVGPLGGLDVVSDLGRVVPALCAGILFGVTGPTYLSPTAIAVRLGSLDVTELPDDWLGTLPPIEDHAKPLMTMQAWTRLGFLEIFVNSVEAQEIAEAAERAIRELMRHIESLILKARQTPHAGDPRNLLEALIRVPLDPSDQPNPDRHIGLLLAEFTAGAVETVNAAFANIVDYLLEHTDYLVEVLRTRTSHDATELGMLVQQLTDPDLDLLLKEILRLNPMGPISFRVCVRPTMIGDATIDPGTVVCLVPAAAMIDERVVSDPTAIRFDRPANCYLHFGGGEHACAGQKLQDPIDFRIALPMLRAMFRGLAALPQLRRAAGPAGKKTQVFPLLADSLTVRFRPRVSPGR